MLTMTKSQINRLGDRLRSQGPASTENLERLQEFRSRFDAPMAEAQARLQEELGVAATTRLKTVNTIMEKLRREATRLAEMQDIAGLRIVTEGTIEEQDELVKKVVVLFPGAKIVDRRKRPSHGYRAVHVIARVDECLVEIQVRTVLQDLWAQAMEKLADEIGRDIRYGVVPAAHEETVRALRDAAERGARIEEKAAFYREVEALFAKVQGLVDRQGQMTPDLQAKLEEPKSGAKGLNGRRGLCF